MNRSRRKLLRSSGGVTLLALVGGAGWLSPKTAHAQWNTAAFDSHSLAEATQALGGAAPTQSKDITFFQTPEIAENGAVVPVGISSAVPNTDAIAILIEKNPNMLAAVFDIPPGTEPTIVTRVKMAQTCNIYALVRADGKYYVASKQIKVTIGGCGG